MAESATERFGEPAPLAAERSLPGNMKVTAKHEVPIVRGGAPVAVEKRVVSVAQVAAAAAAAKMAPATETGTTVDLRRSVDKKAHVEARDRGKQTGGSAVAVGDGASKGRVDAIVAAPAGGAVTAGAKDAAVKDTASSTAEKGPVPAVGLVLNAVGTAMSAVTDGVTSVVHHVADTPAEASDALATSDIAVVNGTASTLNEQLVDTSGSQREVTSISAVDKLSRVAGAGAPTVGVKGPAKGRVGGQEAGSSVVVEGSSKGAAGPATHISTKKVPALRKSADRPTKKLLKTDATAGDASAIGAKQSLSGVGKRAPEAATTVAKVTSVASKGVAGRVVDKPVVKPTVEGASRRTSGGNSTLQAAARAGVPGAIEAKNRVVRESVATGVSKQAPTKVVPTSIKTSDEEREAVAALDAAWEAAINESGLVAERTEEAPMSIGRDATGASGASHVRRSGSLESLPNDPYAQFPEDDEPMRVCSAKKNCIIS